MSGYIPMWWLIWQRPTSDVATISRVHTGRSQKEKISSEGSAAAVRRKTALLVSAVQAAWQFEPVFFSTISAASSFLLGLSVCMESLRACACVCVCVHMVVLFLTHTHTHGCAARSVFCKRTFRAQFFSGRVGLGGVGVCVCRCLF